MRYGYNTNGFSFHRLDDAIAILAELGYEAIALTLDVHHLDPTRVSVEEIRVVRDLLRDAGMTVAIETGARFVLDPRRKHWPTLLDSEEARRRVRETFLEQCLDCGEQLGAELVSFWSGALPKDVGSERAREQLVTFCERYVKSGRERGIDVCLEPEPGMFVESLADFDALRGAVPGLKLALDVGHVFVTEDVPPERVITERRDHLGQVTLDDARDRLHEHLVPGEGAGNWSAILASVRAIDYERPLYVELGRHSHAAVETARRVIAFLRSREPRN